MAILRCKQSFHAIGRPVMVHRGQLFDSSDPIVRGREQLFEAVDDLVEQATAAPGERRSITRKKASAKPAAAPEGA